MKNNMRTLLLILGLITASFNAQSQTALDFNGNNYVQTQTIPALTDFTIEFDIRFEGSGTGTIYQRFLSTFNNGFSLAVDGTATPGNVSVFSSDWPIGWTNVGYIMPLNTWIHMAWVKQGTNLDLYVDGAYVSTTGVGAGGTASSAWYLSANQANFSENANCSMDNFRLWNDVRTAGEISTNYTTCLTGSETDLLVLYDMDEGAGTTTNDLATGDGTQNGTLTNTPLWTGGVVCAAAPPSNDHYWVGGAGNWSDAANHWSSTSGGAPGTTTVPTFGNNAIFDDNSGLAAATVVNIDVPAEADTLTFAAVSNSFVFNNGGNDVTIEHSLIGNASGVTFTGTWGEMIFDASTAGESITSGGTVWAQDFRFDGAEALTLVDDLDIATFTIYVDTGGIDLGANNITCGEFYSTTTSTRNIDMAGSLISAQEGQWDIDSTNLTWDAAGSEITLGDLAGTANFNGGGLAYDSLVSASATTVNYYDDNTFSYTEFVTSSQLNINNGDMLSTDSLSATGTCAAPFVLTTTGAGAGANGMFEKTGYNIIDLQNFDIDSVDAVAPTTYNLLVSDTVNSAGWTMSGTDFYWVGNTGDWNDGSHWAFTSGGAGTGCIPSQVDATYFDANSFNAGSTVTIDSIAFFASMDWTGLDESVTLALDTAMYSWGNVTFAPTLTVVRNDVAGILSFYDFATFDPDDAASIDLGINMIMDDITDIVLLADTLIMSDSSSISLFNGQFDTQNHNIAMGSFYSINNPLAGNDQRQLDLGSSMIDLKGQFYTKGDTTLTLNAGTSYIFIGDSLNYNNSLETEGETFYDVTLYFQECSSCTQQVYGDNTFNELEVLPGSYIYLDSASVQTVTDSLIMKGNCLDSIFLSTNATASLVVADLNKTGVNTDVVMECLNITGIDASGLGLTTLFSTDLGSNTGITFDASPSVTIAFEPDSLLSGFCWGDTVYFENSSSAYTANFNELDFDWYVNDGSLPIEDTPGQIEAEQTAPLQYNFTQLADTATADFVQMTGWSEITDGLNLFTPGTGIANTTAGNDAMRYKFSVGYRLSLVNASGGDAHLVDMDGNALDVSYSYRPEFRIFKNGQDVGVSSPDVAFTDLVFLEDSIVPNGITQFGADTVTFSVTSTNLLPSDLLTIYGGVDVDYQGYTTQPRWKDGNTVGDNNVAMSYRLDIDTIYFEAYPITNSYDIDSLVHEFQTSGDSIIVTLTATDPYNYCAATDTFYIDITRPNVSLITSEPDLEVCPWDSVKFETFSGVTGTEFEFFYNGVSQNTPSVNDTLFTLYNLNDNDTISVLAYEGVCVSDTMPAYGYTVFSNPAFTWTSSDADTSICDGDLVNFDAWAVDSLHQYVYLLNGTGVTAFQDSIATYSTSTLADNDIVYVVAIDTNSCTDTLSMTFNVDPLPPVTLTESTGGTVICENESVTFTAGGADTYIFYIDGVAQGPASATNTLTTTTLQNGDTVSVQGINSNGCSLYAPSTYTYLVTALPTVAMTVSDADSSICSFESVNFVGTGAATYEFYINGVLEQGPSPTAVFTPATLSDNDTIYVEGTFAGCVASSDSVIMEVFAAPTTTLSNDDDGDNTICDGTTVTFTSGGATNYEFFVDGVSQGASSPTNTFVTSSLTNGQMITVEGESNGCIVSQDQTFTVLVNPIVDLFSDDIDNVICDGEPITFTGANAATYEFFINGASVQGPSTTSTLVNPTIPIGAANTVYVVGTAGNGCTDQSATINLTVNAIPTITVTSSDADDIICAGDAVTFTGSGGDMYQFFLDGTPQGSMSPTNTFSTSGLTDGQTLSVTGSLLGCISNSNLITTTVNAVPNVGFASTDVDNIYCEGEIVTYTATGANNYEFFIDGVSQGPSSPVDNINSSGFGTGSFVLEVVGETNNCFNSTNFNVTVNPLPSADLTSSDVDNIICSGETVSYTASGGVLYEFFVNGLSQGTVSPNPTFDINTLGDGDLVSVTVTSPDGCTDDSVYTAITVNPVPSVTLASSDIDFIICSGDLVDFTASGATDYEFFINGVSQGPAGPTAVLSTTGLNNGDNISVTGSSLGCSASSSTITFTVFGAPVVNLTNNSDNQLCVGENSDLTASGAANYEFFVNGVSAGPSSPVNTFTSPLNDGDVVTVEGETNGCVNASLDSYTFTVYNFPTLTSSTSTGTTICLNDMVTLTASGAMTYEFAVNGTVVQSGATSTYDINTLQDGDVVTITGFNGDCPSTVDTYVFTVNTMILDLTVAPSALVCEGELVTFTASGADQYEFSVNGVSVAPMGTGNTFSSTSLTDNDEVTFTGYNNTSMCTQPHSDYILMNVMTEPVITGLSSLSFCEGDSVVLVSNAGYGNQWYVDGTPIAGATDTSYVAYSSGSYTLDVTAGGTGDIWSFGHNPTGTFGNGNNLDNADPTVATTTEQFDEITSGYAFVLGVTTAGDLYAWGENSSGQLGDGTYTSTNVPQLVPTLTNVKTAATTETSSMAVTNTGDVYVWGNNAQGQLGTGNTAVISFPFQNAAIANTDSIAGGRDHFVILRNDGTVWTVGNNDYGQLGQGNLTSSMNAVQVPGLANVVSVGAGEYHSFAIDNNGDLYVWGNNGSGQLGLGDLNNRLDPTLSPLQNIVNAQGGASHSAFLSSDNKVYTSGANGFGQLGHGTFTDTLVPTQVNISGAEMISTGQYTTLVKRLDNSVYGFGNNTEDQLSSPSGLTVPTPEHIVDLDGVEFIEASQSSSHVIYAEDQTCTSQATIVDVLSVPPVTITSNVDTLTATAGASYQWYFEGNPIPGATSQTYEANESGNYHVEVTFANGCTGTSPDYYHSMTSIKDLALGTISLYPNPAKNVLNLEFSNELKGDVEITILDQTGRIVLNDFYYSNSFTIDISTLESGVYTVAINNAGVRGNIRFVKAEQ